MSRCPWLALVIAMAAVSMGNISTALALTAEEVRANGAFGFPQANAQVLCDTSELRVSVWNNFKFFYVQAVHWSSATSTGIDSAAVFFDVDNDRKPTPKRDRVFYLNSNERHPGLWSNFALSSGWSRLVNDSRGRGAISHPEVTDGAPIRIDSFCLTLLELGIRPGDDIRLVYWSRTSGSAHVVDSVGYQPEKSHEISQIPMVLFHEVVLGQSQDEVDLSVVPDAKRHP